MRLTDDFLFITTVKSDAQRFLEVMVNGIPEYGCFISVQKTLINFNDKSVEAFKNEGQLGVFFRFVLRRNKNARE